MRSVRTLLLVLLMLTPDGPASAQLQRWVDEQGTEHYTAPPGDPEPLAPRGTRIPFTPGSPVLIGAMISGRGPITLILDTGADRTVVTPQALSRLGISTDNARPARIKGVGGTVDAYGIWVDAIQVGDAKAGPFLVIAHDASINDADGILARDFLDNFKVTIDAGQGVVTLEPR
ncbi:MAG: hypothetical protein DMD82_10415 [Candidatus Rokuibacteriota bacterium]|nr:MAG: hypothetical protein DMD82_10415 [Candidatus Rokubacteria bacterium]